MYALEKLSELDRDLHGYVLAPELKQSLHQAIHTDQLAIQQFVQAKTRQQESLEALLLETDQLLKQAIQQNNLSPARISHNISGSAGCRLNRFSVQELY